MGVVCQDRDLPAHPGAGVQAHIAQGDGQQTGRYLLTRGDNHVIFVIGLRQPGGRGARAVSPGDQLIGLAGHGRDHHRDLLARGHFGRDQTRHSTDALQIGHRSAAKFHHQPRHAEALPLLLVRTGPARHPSARAPF